MSELLRGNTGETEQKVFILESSKVVLYLHYKECLFPVIWVQGWNLTFLLATKITAILHPHIFHVI